LSTIKLNLTDAIKSQFKSTNDLDLPITMYYTTASTLHIIKQTDIICL